MERWPTKRLAKALGKTPQRVLQYVKEGVLLPPGPGGFDPDAAVLAYCKWQAQQTADAPLEMVRVRHLTVMAELKELQLRRERGELHDVRKCRKVTREAVLHMERNLKNIPDRCSGPCATELSHHTIYKILQTETRQVMENVYKELMELGDVPTIEEETTHDGP